MIKLNPPEAAGPEVPAARQGGSSAMAVVALAIVIATLSSNVVSPLYSLYQQRWGFSSSALTGIFAVYAVGVLAAMLLVGPLSDRIGRRRVMVPSLVVVALGALAFCFARDLRWLVAARVLAGIGTGALVGAASAALVDVEPNGNRRRAATLATLGFTQGAAIGPALSTVSLNYNLWPLQLPFLLVAALAGSTAVALCRVRWPVAESKAVFRLREWRPQRVSIPPPMLGSFLLAAGALALSWSVGSLFAALGPTFATRLLGIRNPALAGLVVVGFQFCGGTAQLLSGPYPPRRTLSLGPLAMTAGLAACLAGTSFASAPLFVLGTMAAAVGFGATFVGSAAVVTHSAPPERRGEVVSALYIAGYATMALPILAVGRGVDALGLQPTLLLFTAIIGSASVLVALLSLRRV